MNGLTETVFWRYKLIIGQCDIALKYTWSKTQWCTMGEERLLAGWMSWLQTKWRPVKSITNNNRHCWSPIRNVTTTQQNNSDGT